MYTRSARASLRHGLTVSTGAALARSGVSADQLRAQLDARRWQRFGQAILTHNGPPTPGERRAIILLNAGPRAVLTAFSAAGHAGMTGWERDVTHVLVPGGTHVRRLAGMPVRVHFTGSWATVAVGTHRRVERLAPALVRAASTFVDARPACGILAAGVQQRLLTAADLRAAVHAAPRARHRAVLLSAIDDVEQGAQALSEIDFARLCRRFGLPAPVRQAVRTEPDGRRRYLDAEWVRSDGCRVVVEVDGAVHLSPGRWWDDQHRQNELAIGGDLVLRFPGVIVRTQPAKVADQLERALRR